MPAIPHLRHDAAFSSEKSTGYFSSILGASIDLLGKESPEYRAVDNYLVTIMNKKYSTDVMYSLPYVLTLNCNDHIFAAIGIRLAESGPLFLERYLHYPVEQELGIFFKAAIKRETIVEAGNVISSWRGNSKLLLITLINLLYKAEREWLLILSNREIEDALNKMNFTMMPLSDRSLKILNADKEQWEGYFSESSRIMFCHIPTMISNLTKGKFIKYYLILFSNQIVEIAEQWEQSSE